MSYHYDDPNAPTTRLVVCPACGDAVEVGRCCTGCDVYFGDPCSVCDGVGYHKRTCAALDIPSNDDSPYI